MGDRGGLSGTLRPTGGRWLGGRFALPAGGGSAGRFALPGELSISLIRCEKVSNLREMS